MNGPLDTIEIGSLRIRNRIAMAPMKTAYGTDSGKVTDRLIAFVRRRVEGGVGLIISEPFYVHKRGREHFKQLGIDADDKLDGIGRLAAAVHASGGRVFAHLNHAGRAANPKGVGGPPDAPSAVVCSRTGAEPKALDEQGIHEIVSYFANAARRAREAGFDGVELQFGLGYLVAQFLSPATNRREDRYGGSRENRMRFASEVFAAVRDAVSNDFPIGVRISGSEKAPGGLEIDDAVDLARQLESWGADLIHVATGSNCESTPWYFQHMSLPPGVNEELAARIHNEVNVPVMVAGRLGDPPRIREVIGAGMADMIAVGRGLLADPDLPSKMRDGKDDEVMLCGQCLQACFVGVKSGRGIACNINPEVGFELDEVKPADRPMHVVVVGGGPAGMQAALTAGKRGLRVTLFEKGRLGGQFALAFLAPGKQSIERPLRSLIARVERSGIELRVEEEATVEKVMALRPTAVILATGSKPIVPDIPGLGDAVTGEEAIAGSRQIGNEVLVIGGGMVGIEVAELLAQQGKSCTVVKRSEEVTIDLDPITMKLTLKRLSSLPVQLCTETEIVRLDGKKAVVEHRGEERELGPFDSVVVARGNESYDPLSAQLSVSQGISVELVGDAKRPARVYDAVLSGHRAALNI